MANIKIKRVYEPPSKDDGFRILVDRLWPRGVTKEKAAIDLWFKEIAPSPDLRKWFCHDPAKWDEFRKNYSAELSGNTPAVAKMREHMAQGPVTLVYAAADVAHTHALVLLDFLTKE
jgi:uncharacterized protein YeaO (DUF488 family)